MKGLATISFSIMLVLGIALAAAGCTSTADANKKCTAGPGKVCCTPGVNVFCRCPGGQEEGTMQCLPGGETFGNCGPCDGSTLPADIARVEEDPDTAVDDTGSRRADTSEPIDTTPDIAQVTCNAFAVSLGADKPVSLSGDTSKAKAVMAGFGACAAANLSKDIVYEVKTTERGKVTATVTPASGFDTMVYVRSGPCGKGDQLTCADAGSKGSIETAVFFTEAGDPHYVVVDGKSSSGVYSLQLELQAGSYCGDSTVDPEEACDDGNQSSGDGCSAECAIDGEQTAAQLCPGTEVHVWEDLVSITNSTDANPNNQKANCGGGGGRDAIYQIVPHRTGTLQAVVKSSIFDTVIYARSSACTPGTELACSNKIKGNGDESITFPIQNGVPIWVVVDGYKYGQGQFTLELTKP